MPHPLTKTCPQCGTTMHFELVYPDPEVNSHWPCPVDGTRWDLSDDGERLVPFGSIRREPAGQPRNPR